MNSFFGKSESWVLILEGLDILLGVCLNTIVHRMFAFFLGLYKKASYVVSNFTLSVKLSKLSLIYLALSYVQRAILQISQSYDVEK